MKSLTELKFAKIMFWGLFIWKMESKLRKVEKKIESDDVISLKTIENCRQLYLNSDITYRAEIHSDYVLKMVHSENEAKTLKT